MNKKTLVGKVFVLTGFSTNYEPSYMLEFKENFEIKAGDRIVFSQEPYSSVNVYLVRKEDNE